MLTLSQNRVRRGCLSCGMLVAALGVIAALGSPVQAQPRVLDFKMKLDLNPLPFTDTAQNAYWHGHGKMVGNVQELWDITVTLNTADKRRNYPVPGRITLSKVKFQAVNRSDPGQVIDLNLVGFVDIPTEVMCLHNGTIDASGNQTIGSTKMLGDVQSWWVVEGVRIGANVVDGELVLP